MQKDSHFSAVYNLIKYISYNNIYLAYSGGLDSQVLLHILAILKEENPELKISAIHINHGLSNNADLWANSCNTTCNKFNIPFIEKKVHVPNLHTKGHSLEATARHLRYAAFAEILKQDDYLLTAHHKDDQAETLLLQLFRGAGPKGLSAMPEKIPFQKGFLVRPLLNFTREDLKKYAKENNLEWNEDESNADVNFDRNYIRHEIMPLIKKRWPSAHISVARAANHYAEATELLEELAKQDLLNSKGTQPNTLSITKVLLLPKARQKNLLRYWIHSLKLPIPSTIKLETILSNVLMSRKDAMPLVAWQGAEVRRYKDNLYIMPPLLKIPKGLILNWNDLTKPFVLPHNLGVLNWQEIKKQNPLISDKGKITIRFRQNGETIKFSNRYGTHSLKKIFQEKQIPSWKRETIPLLYCDDKLLHICLRTC